MAWCKRGKYRYFCRSYRIGDRVGNLYFGRGAAARLAAELDATRRAEHRARGEAWSKLERQWREAAEPLLAFEAAATLAMEAVLLAAGFHRIKRQPWRRRQKNGHRQRRTTASSSRSSAGPD